MKAQPAPEKIYCSHCNLKQFNRMQERCIHCDKLLKGGENENPVVALHAPVSRRSSDFDGLLHVSVTIH